MAFNLQIQKGKKHSEPLKTWMILKLDLSTSIQTTQHSPGMNKRIQLPLFESNLLKSSLNDTVISYFHMLPDCTSLTLCHRAACQRHERSLTHNNNPSKSALISFWVITVFSLECFVFRFACSVSKANNHSLFTVWVGLFFLFFSFRRANYTQEWQLSEKETTNSLARFGCKSWLKSRGRDSDYSPADCWLCSKDSKELATNIYMEILNPL